MTAEGYYVSLPGDENLTFIIHHLYTFVSILKIPWRRAWKPTPVFLPGECHGQRSLVSYSPQGRKELDMTEVT